MNGSTLASGWLKLLLGVAIGAGGAVAATFSTFETQAQHNHDIQTLINGQIAIIERLDRLILEGRPHQRVPQLGAPDQLPPSPS